MGKSLRGKECGKGICQRKDGLSLSFPYRLTANASAVVESTPPLDNTNAFITHLSYLRYICNAASSLKLPLNSTVIVLVLFFLIPLADTQL